MCLGGNSLRGFEETRHVKGGGAHATGVGYGSKVGVAGLEVCDFGVRAPTGVGGTRIAQIVIGEAGLPTRHVELARQFVCQSFIV